MSSRLSKGGLARTHTIAGFSNDVKGCVGRSPRKKISSSRKDLFDPLLQPLRIDGTHRVGDHISLRIDKDSRGDGADPIGRGGTAGGIIVHWEGITQLGNKSWSHTATL